MTLPDAPPVETARLDGLAILAAEDNPTNRIVLSEMLELEGARVVCVGNGHELVERIRRDGADAWDLVLTDIRMPVTDGYEASRQLRDIAPQLPVVGLSAESSADERSGCLAAGMVDHLAKPYRLDDLVATIRRNLRARR